MKNQKILNRSFKSGFTLIELLVVVAIIGILASVVLVALNNARTRGGDAGVKTNLHTVSTQAEFFFDNNGLSYLTESAENFGPATCPFYVGNEVKITMFEADKNIADAIAEATLRGGNGNSCYNSSSAWAVAVGLASNAEASWCVDSEGTSRQVDSAPDGAINSGTFLCN
jgi:prepilin-type N-terminal cleavage/methylation domain-containing protein